MESIQDSAQESAQRASDTASVQRPALSQSEVASPPRAEAVAEAEVVAKAVEDSSIEAPQPVLRFEHASARVGGRVIWRDMSFEAHAGEFIAVLGPNGAGKSTLLKATLGLLPVDEGRVSVFG